MDYYQKMYTVLFRAVTETIGDIEARNYGMAKERLIRAQQKCEEYTSVRMKTARCRNLSECDMRKLFFSVFHKNN